MKNIKIAAVGSITASLLIGSFAAADEPIRVGAATYGLQGEFMQLWSNALQRHPAVESGQVEVTVFDGRYDALVQNNQFESMISRQYDAILFVPIDADACVSAVAMAASAGIPVVGSNALCNTDQLAAYVGSDDVLAGEMLANSVLTQLDYQGNVVILEGPIGQTGQIDRGRGIDKVLSEHPEVSVLERRTANWSRAEAMALMENWLTSHRGQIQGVIAQNDEMAIGAIEAIIASGLSVNDFAIAGADGITDALTAVKEGHMESILQDADAQAQGGLDVALRLVKGDSYQPLSSIWDEYSELEWNGGQSELYYVPWTPVTLDNVEQLLEKRAR
ncbi:substrate-binding domain-containing protein [Franzmannia qiaohouensis]|uniref:Substrate-binding domain-containing protein n=1 Tax=Franzmannia qiaohouensis TaxID=1329370 RepID=A0ABU1HAJ2_9GAMM|nr:substrate-binding domain-containing protein [Halomonas qiaohouensis]MDR5904453.1 substrate-binding domain-containing protein [Halomonas qiaohouensis]